MSLKISIILAICLIGLSQTKNLPSYVKTCKRGDTNFIACVKESIESIRPKLKAGIKEFNLTPTDPLHVPFANISTVAFTIVMQDADLHNVFDFKVEELDIDLTSEHPYIHAELNFPHVHLATKYIFKGQIITLTADGSGDLTADYDDNKVDLDIKMKVIEKDGQKHFEIKDLKIHILPKKIKGDFKNLFGDNEALNKEANTLINENSDKMFELAGDNINGIFAKYTTSIFQHIFAKYTIDQLF